MEQSGMGTLIGLLAIVALVAANGLFVASEFAIVSVRRSRLIPLIDRGSKSAQRVMR
ncbi:MAG: CNNM domain-containing protein, partial [bacterium]